MRYSWQLRRKALHQLLDNRHGRMRMRLQVLAAAAVLVLLAAGPLLQTAHQPLSDQARAPEAAPAAADPAQHRRAVFVERRRMWDSGRSSSVAAAGEQP
jgi:hypothetical protein